MKQSFEKILKHKKTLMLKIRKVFDAQENGCKFSQRSKVSLAPIAIGEI